MSTQSTGSAATLFKAYSPADRAALTELRAHIKDKKKLDADVSLSEAIACVTPGFETPAHLKGC